MVLIPCSLNCVHQCDGCCTLKTADTVSSIHAGCAYFKERSAGEEFNEDSVFPPTKSNAQTEDDL